MVPTARDAAIIFDSTRTSARRRKLGLAIALAATWVVALLITVVVLLYLGTDLPDGAAVRAAAALALFALALVAARRWLTRKRIYWNSQKQKLVLENRGLFSTHLHRIYLGEIAYVRMRRGTLKSVEYWDVEFSDFAGSVTWLTRCFAHAEALTTARGIAEALGRPLKEQ